MRVVDGQVWKAAEVPFPEVGAWRLHHSPTQLSHREDGCAVDRFDDPDGGYRVRYLATSPRGAMLEVLDHFRANDEAEATLAATEGVEGLDILEEEPAGSVPERWLSAQRFARGVLPGLSSAQAKFADVNNAALLAALNTTARVQAALNRPIAINALGDARRLDEGTIRLVGDLGRPITQGVSREVYEAEYPGIAFKCRHDDDEQCWAIFDDRIHTKFEDEAALDNTNPEHLAALQHAAELYKLQLPGNWVAPPLA